MLPLVDQALSDLNASRGDLGLVAMSDGPGSFTGLRVGVAMAKALTVSAGVPLYAASTLLVRAAGIARPGDRVMACSSALRGQVFAGVWHFGAAGEIRALADPVAVGLEELLTFPDPDRIVGEGPPVLLDAIGSAWGLPVIGPPEAWPSAVTLLSLVGVQGGARPITDPATWVPTYGRPAEAQARWEREHGRPLPNTPGDSR
jgi:tRNA threonylcarbamoyladenosine biosynthesis protein TsaB